MLALLMQNGLRSSIFWRPIRWPATKSSAVEARARFAFRARQRQDRRLSGHHLLQRARDANLLVEHLRQGRPGKHIEGRNKHAQDNSGRIGEGLQHERKSAVSKAGERILKAAREALAFANGDISVGFAVHVPKAIDVKALRSGLKLSQDEFARSLAFPSAPFRIGSKAAVSRRRGAGASQGDREGAGSGAAGIGGGVRQ